MKNLMKKLRALIKGSPKRILSGKIISMEDVDYGDYQIAKAVQPIGCPECGQIIYSSIEEHDREHAKY